jgi:lactococcin 972 family bacteriocin
MRRDTVTKRSMRSAAGAAAVLATSVALTLGGVSAAHASDEPGAPSARGAVVIPDNTETTIGEGGAGAGLSPYEVVEVGGGTWNYGSQITVVPPKTCWSNYKHNTKYHSSTTIMGDVNSTGYASARLWSESRVTGGLSYSCSAYWNTY